MENLTKEERMWAMLCHLGIFGGNIIPFGHIIIPLVIWLLKKEDSAYVDYHGKESLNFQLSMTIYIAIAVILAFILVGFILAIMLWFFNLIIVIVAGIKAYDGKQYRYPLTIRFIK